jgi:SAM-dependent methyltransferase
VTTHWTRHLRHWQLLGPPLRPHAEVLDRVRSLIGANDARCLLLGSTVEYAALGLQIVSVDANFAMVAGLWKSGDPAGLAIQSDWTCMPIRSQTFSHVLADGSLNAVPSAELPAVLSEVTRVLLPEGVLIARIFCRPDIPETAEDIRRDVLRGMVGSFHALKWRVAMAVLPDPECSDIAVQEIRDAVNAQYPHRGELCGITGWSPAEVDTLDVYDGSTAIYNFPTERTITALLRRWFDKIECIPCGSYPLAERCPLVIARKPLGPARRTGAAA